MNKRAYYKMDVDVALRSLNPPVLLPYGKHPVWNFIEQCYHDGITVEECVKRITEDK